MSIKLTDKIESVAKAGVIVDAIQVSGGYIVVNTSLDEIKQQSIKIGTKAYIANEDKEYRYTINGWKQLSTNSDVRTTTYASLSAAESDLSNLTQGQIITVVNETIAEAYIVGYNKVSLVKIGSGSIEDTPVDEATIQDIISGDYSGEEPSNAADINAIISGSYSGEPTSEVKSSIDSIIDGTYEEV